MSNINADQKAAKEFAEQYVSPWMNENPLVIGRSKSDVAYGFEKGIAHERAKVDELVRAVKGAMVYLESCGYQDMPRDPNDSQPEHEMYADLKRAFAKFEVKSGT